MKDKVNVKCSRTVRDDLAHLAIDLGRDMQDMAEEALSQYIAKIRGRLPEKRTSAKPHGAGEKNPAMLRTG